VAEQVAVAPITIELVVPSKDPAVVDYRMRAAAILADAEALAVNSEEAKAQAVNILSGIARVNAEAEKKRKGIVSPPNDFVHGVNDLFKDVLAPLKKADSNLRQKILDFNREEVRRQQEAAAALQKANLAKEELLSQASKAEAEGKPETASKLLDQAVEEEKVAATAAIVVSAPAPVRSVNTGLGAANVRKEWTFEVVKLEDVPREYFALDETKVRKDILSGKREIAGLRIFQEEKLAVKK
jgi:hypothetical protein